jgi:hypothetical protein
MFMRSRALSIAEYANDVSLLALPHAMRIERCTKVGQHVAVQAFPMTIKIGKKDRG